MFKSSFLFKKQLQRSLFVASVGLYCSFKKEHLLRIFLKVHTLFTGSRLVIIVLKADYLKLLL